MKLLLFVHSLRGGGAERVTVTLANRWAERGRKVTVVTLVSSDDDRFPLNPEVARVSLELAGNSAGVWQALKANSARVRALRHVLRREQPDVAIAIMSTSSVLLALASFGLRHTKCFGTERTYPPRFLRGHAWEFLRVRTYGWLDSVVVLTTECREWVLANTLARHSTVIPNPISWPLAKLPPVVAPRSVGSPRRRRLLAVGRLRSEKGFDLLIDVFARLSSDFPEWEMVIVGEGPVRSDLESRIAQAGRTKDILLPGYAGNISDWYVDADLFVLTSHFEGFPNALTEAMAHGLPSVSFDCDTGPRDIIRHGIDGLLVPPGDADALAKALRRLMQDDCERARFAAQATQVRARFAVDSVVDAWERLFEEVAS